MNDILKYNKQEVIDMSDLRNSLIERGVAFTDQELNAFFNSLKFDHNTSENVSRLEIYANAHLFRLDVEKRAQHQTLLEKIAISTGVGISENDL